jgi:hypothetical protein
VERDFSLNPEVEREINSGGTVTECAGDGCDSERESAKSTATAVYFSIFCLSNLKSTYFYGSQFAEHN